MAKNPNKKVAPKDEPMNGAMKFFLAGCVAELYLLILRRFYINADSELTRIAWYDHYLWTLAGIGAGVLAVGVIAALVLRSSAKKQKSAWILAALRNRQFLSLDELNRAIWEKLADFNHKPFQKKDGSRASDFEEEKLFLLPLPPNPFELAEWKTATVQYNYHISVDRMNYSVP